MDNLGCVRLRLRPLLASTAPVMPLIWMLFYYSMMLGLKLLREVIMALTVARLVPPLSSLSQICVVQNVQGRLSRDLQEAAQLQHPQQ